MKKDPEIFLKHIMESIEDIEKYTKGQTKDKFVKAKMTQDAVVKRIEIIGEAVKNLPASFKTNYPTIEWRDIAGMRDILIHEYFGINVNVVWKTVREDIPKLKTQISRISDKL